MKLIKPSTEILTPINGEEILKFLEQIARTCYKSEDKITDKSAEELIKMLLKREHEAMLEFFDIVVKFTCDRGVSHEIVRHRLGSYAQESTRYCNYSKDKFDNQVTFILPSWINIKDSENVHEHWTKDTSQDEQIWYLHMVECELVYNKLIAAGWQAQQARAVLPNSLKTEINAKYNIREWRHFFKMRCSPAAHPQMRELTLPLLKEFHEKLPILFDDIYQKYFTDEQISL